MDNKAMVTALIERMPDELVSEVRQYAEYLYAKTQYSDWSRLSLAHLAARYVAEEVEYTLDDVKK